MSGDDGRAARHGEPAWGIVASGGQRGWILLASGGADGDSLILDELGDYWWARLEGRTARLVRPCSDDEAERIRDSLPPHTKNVLRLD
ncbi:MAG: hypothetical protein HY775_03205 [Acidobacteria bacterium]|nr:hypothetical protein [Acidobacteriota bacterium]